MGLKIGLHENLDGLVAGVNFDADWCIAEIDFVPPTIVSTNNRVRHSVPAPLTRPVLLAALIAATNLGIIVRLSSRAVHGKMSVAATHPEAAIEAAGVRFFPDRRKPRRTGNRTSGSRQRRSHEVSVSSPGRLNEGDLSLAAVGQPLVLQAQGA
jgi:hypothetical protein